MPSYRKEKHGLWTRQRAKSGPADTYTAADGTRYEIHPAGNKWLVVVLPAGTKVFGFTTSRFKTQREARQWIIENIIERNEK